tara:strand:- start:294 stop:701 length:408 start_codon:yes stop_codon:yes gene_type:complete
MNMLDSIHRYTIGFDSLFDQLSTFQQRGVDSYPPHNIVKVDESNFFIELALAGFKKDELNINWEKDLLTVEGDRKKRQDNEKYIYKSIGNRIFKKTFSLAELVEVKDAEFTDGVLYINLEKHIPEEDKLRNISIK